MRAQQDAREHGQLEQHTEGDSDQRVVKRVEHAGDSIGGLGMRRLSPRIGGATRREPDPRCYELLGRGRYPAQVIEQRLWRNPPPEELP